MKKELKFYHPTEKNGELTNYFPSTFDLDGESWMTVEHYFQAQKTQLGNWRTRIQQAPTPGEAKHLAWQVPDYNEANWLQERVSVMRRALCEKFRQNHDLGEFLIATGDCVLIEDSPDDAYWGKVNGVGENMMGRLLMEIRAELQNSLQRS